MPSSSVEPVASKLTVSPVSAGFGEAVNEAIGSRFWTVREWVSTSVSPSWSVTRSEISMIAGAA